MMCNAVKLERRWLLRVIIHFFISAACSKCGDDDEVVAVVPAAYTIIFFHM